MPETLFRVKLEPYIKSNTNELFDICTKKPVLNYEWFNLSIL